MMHIPMTKRRLLQSIGAVAGAGEISWNSSTRM